MSAATAGAPGQPLTGDALVLHVARRATFGPTPELLEEIRSHGVDGWIEQQLRPHEIDDREVERSLARLPDLSRRSSEFKSSGRFGDDVLADLRVAAVVRAVRSRRHLLQVLVDLWHDRLATSAAKSPVEWFQPAYDRDAIRPHALGRFADLLKAATRAPAMLEYLDTAGSRAPEVNENHGRELLELHTVGRSAGFTESDVQGASRVLSGWTLDPSSFQTVFDPGRHHAGPATVLGWSTPGRAGAAGADDLDSMLEHLALHPTTATGIATLLAQRFVADSPPAEVVESTAAAYLASGSDVAATLRHLFATPAFRSAGAPIVRRPLDLFAAQLRATAADLKVRNVVERVAGAVGELPALLDPLVDTANVVEPLVARIGDEHSIRDSVTWVLSRNGQALFQAPNPSGFPVAGARWTSGDAMLRRWSLGALLAHDALGGIALDPEALAGGAARAGDAVDELARRCLSAAAAPATRDGALAVMGLAETDPIEDSAALRRALAFLLSAPEAQLR